MARAYEKTARFEIRCSPEDLEGWRCTAEEHGLSLAKYNRACLNHEPVLSRTMKADPALVRQLAAIGNNLNQLTRWANTYKQGVESSLVLDALLRIYEELDELRKTGQ